MPTYPWVQSFFLGLLFWEATEVWRAFFFAVGAMMVIVGVECLLIESATFASKKAEAVQVSTGWFQQSQPVQLSTGKTRIPPEWMPWSLIASGTVVVLYALTLPKRWGKRGD